MDRTAMTRRAAKIAAVMVVAALGSFPGRAARAANVVWTNAAGGSWNSSANWNNGAGPVPGASDTARIALSNATFTVNINTNPNIAKLLASGVGTGLLTLNLNGHTLTLANPSGIGTATTLNMTDATIAGAGSFDNLGTIVMKDTCHITSQLVTEAGSKIQVMATAASDADLMVSGSFTNNGLLELNDDGANKRPVLEVFTGTLTNGPTGELRSDRISSGQTRWIFARIANQGLFRVKYGAIVEKADAVHTNTGTIDLLAQTTLDYNLFGTGSSFTNAATGTISVAGNSGIRVGGPGSFIQSGNFSTSGAGTPASLSLNGVKVTFTKPLDIPFSLFLSYITVNGPDMITVQSGCQLAASYVDTLNCPLKVLGNLEAYGNLVLNGPLTTEYGDSIKIDGSLTVANSFTNNGVVALGSLASGGSATLRVLVGPLVNSNMFITTPNGAPGALALNAQLDNQGYFLVNHGMAVSSAGAAHTNSGLFSVLGGDLAVTLASRFDNSGTMEVFQGRTASFDCDSLYNTKTGVLWGRGTYSIPAGKLTNAGQITPGASNTPFEGILTINGGLNELPGSRLNISFHGLPPGSGADQLVVTGAARLNGRLYLDQYCGYYPATGQTYAPLTFASRVNDFADVVHLDMGSGLSWSRTLEATDMLLTAVGTLVNTAPVAVPDTFYCAPNGQTTFSPVLNDTDAQGNTLYDVNVSYSGTFGQAYEIYPFRSIHYQALNFTYTDYIHYQVYDCLGGVSNVATIVIIVGPLPAGVSGSTPARVEFVLGQPSPNPSRGSARMAYRWNGAAPGRLAIFDAGGRSVRRLVLPGGIAGERIATWDGRDEAGRCVAAGMYLCRLESETADGRRFAQTQRIMRLR